MSAKNKDKELQEPKNEEQDGNQNDSILSTEEIVIEELAIDGICGVY